jgi:hypothetical protein
MVWVMFERMLSRERKPFRTRRPDSSLLENRTIEVEAVKGLLYLHKTVLVYDRTANKIADIDVSRKSANHLRRDITFDGRDVNLYIHDVNMHKCVRLQAYLHQSL